MAVETKITTSAELQDLAAAFNKSKIRIPRVRIAGISKEIGKELSNLLLKPTKAWRHIPKATVKTKVTQSMVEVKVTIADEPYVYVSLGTPPHVIRAKHAPRLVFHEGYQAKTSPNSLAGRAGGEIGGLRYAVQVYHPGIQARNFHTIATEKMAPLLERMIVKELKAELAEIKSVIG